MKNLLKLFSVFVFLGVTAAFVSCKTETDSTEAEPTYYTVSFNSNGGTAVASQAVESGKTAAQPANPTKTASKTATFSFSGWYKESVAFDFSTPITSDITLTAQWTETAIPAENPDDENENNQNEDEADSPVITNDETVTISFDSDGGSAVLAVTGKYGEAYTKPENPTKQGYTFISWNPALPDTLCAMTVTAQWDINSYTVTFNTNGGSAVASQTVEYNGTATEPSAPTKDGFDFTGWYAGGEIFDFSTKITGDITLTAGWEEKFTVSFNSDGGTEIDSQSVGSGKYAVQPDAPEKDGFVFAGWYLEEEKYNFTAPVAGSITLSAKWLPKTVAYVTKEKLKDYVGLTGKFQFYVQCASYISGTATLRYGADSHNFNYIKKENTYTSKSFTIIEEAAPKVSFNDGDFYVYGNNITFIAD